MNVSKRIDSLNFFKALACIGIVLIHCKFPGNVGGILRTWGKIGVPFFMMISGYFCLYGDSNEVKNSKLVGKMKHILTITVGAGCFYFVLYLMLNCIWGGHELSYVTKECVTFAGVARLFIQNSPLVYSHLWFLLALIYCYVFTLLIGNRIKGKWKVWYIVVALLIFTLLSEMLPTFGYVDEVTWLEIGIRNIFLFRALPFFLTGVILRENKQKILKLNLSPGILIVLMMLGEIIAVGERALLCESQFYIGTYIAVISIFIFCVKFPVSINSHIEFVGAELSMYVYILHVGIMNILDYAVAGLGIDGMTAWNWSRPIAVIIISMLIAYFANIFSKKIKFSLSKKRQEKF